MPILAYLGTAERFPLETEATLYSLGAEVHKLESTDHFSVFARRPEVLSLAIPFLLSLQRFGERHVATT